MAARHHNNHNGSANDDFAAGRGTADCWASQPGDGFPHLHRLTVVTLLSNSGIPAEHIADLAGHRDTRMVERVYRHRNQTIDVGRAAMQKALGDGTT